MNPIFYILFIIRILSVFVGLGGKAIREKSV